jgi:hypothetical protein
MKVRHLSKLFLYETRNLEMKLLVAFGSNLDFDLFSLDWQAGQSPKSYLTYQSSQRLLGILMIKGDVHCVSHGFNIIRL